jgi:ubiquinone/menaquinone biosynthesis C-methylase UbiE
VTKAALLLVCAGLCCLPGTGAQVGGCSASAADSLRARRDRYFKIPEILQALELSEGSRAADIGAGDGEYEVALSVAVGAAGRVYAEDIKAEAIKLLRKRVDENHLTNVDVIEGLEADPKLPGGLDAVLMVITYHEIADHETMLRHILAALKPGGRFVVVEMAPNKTLTRPRGDQVKNHVLARTLAESEIGKAGFEILSHDDHFLDYPDEESTRWMSVFRKPPAR